ncbi:hypothetical protein ACPCSP_25605 [Streptomyces cinereoruber]|uniref:hypothetical protein n=1 Tax=Streptomyces cinereoruber TaxID=67260 RepID=UPI003C2B2F0B
MDRTPLPDTFDWLAPLGTGEPTVSQAKDLTRALKDVPTLMKWLRDTRRDTTRALLDSGTVTRKELAPHMEVSVQRVSDIASGHLTSAALARAKKAGAGAQAPTQLPESFGPLASLAELDEGLPSIPQVKKLTRTLKDAPAAQKWLRESRERVTRALLDAGHTAEELAPHLGVGRQRVYDIAGGHQSAKDLARKARATDAS